MNFSIVAERPLENYKKCDISLILISILLWGIGIFTLYVCSGNYGTRAFNDSLYFVKRQLISSCLGFMLFVIFATFSMETIKRFLPLMVVIALLLSLMTFIPGIGIEVNGARRWIRLGFMTFQPSEMVKFVIVLYLANYFEKQARITDSFDKTVFPAVLVSFVMVGSIAMARAGNVDCYSVMCSFYFPGAVSTQSNHRIFGPGQLFADFELSDLCGSQGNLCRWFLGAGTWFRSFKNQFNSRGSI